MNAWRVLLVWFVAAALTAGCGSEETPTNNDTTDFGGITTPVDMGEGETCGNGVVDTGEECDPMIAAGLPGACPTTCDSPPETCATASVVGSADACTARCELSTITTCGDGDSCCPLSCTSDNDDDCEPTMDDCGNGMLDAGEECDPMIADGMPGACPSPTSCNDNNTCTADVYAGEATMCTARCINDAVTMCSDDDGCCPGTCTSDNDNDCTDPTTCGNGQLDAGEACDPQINPGNPGACPVACNDNMACTTDTLMGSAQSCTATCTNNPVTTCSLTSDGCCPTTCDNTTDADCVDPNTCGNGTLDAGEQCDPQIAAGQPGACPTTCDDGMACTTDSLAGDASMCTAQCLNAQINMCSGQTNDGCCPGGCNNGTDTDCPMVNTCGNGTLDFGEECDPQIAAGMPGACPTMCDDGMTCTIDRVVGDATQCSARCASTAIVMCSNTADGCCPSTCNNSNDSDCPATNLCGNNVVDQGEACDSAIAAGQPGACPTTCPDDGMACTTEALQGSAAMCSARCTTSPVTTCSGMNNADGCCPAGCDSTTDADCGAAPSPVGSACTNANECEALPTEQPICGNNANGDFTNGYCTSTCIGDADCPTGAVCFGADATTSPPTNGFCYDSCQTTNDCRMGEGYSCFDLGQNNKLVCAPSIFDPTLGGDTGTACTADNDCKAGAGFTKVCITEAEQNWVGGYCASGCQMDTDCPSAGDTCIGQRCLKTCQSNTDCGRADYRCYDYLGTGTAVCAPNPQTTPPMGAACTMDDDCRGTQVGFNVCISANDGYPGGYCTAGCFENDHCPAGSICSIPKDASGNPTGSGLCVDDCTANTDCRAGYECYDRRQTGDGDYCAPVASGPGAVGATCAALADCSGGQQGVCLAPPIYSDGYCSEACDPSATAGTPLACPANSMCVPFRSGPTCHETCTTDVDCRMMGMAGYTCEDLDGDATTTGDSVCLPAATSTTAQVGDACTALKECSGGSSGICIAEQDDGSWSGGYCSQVNCVQGAAVGQPGACPTGSTCLVASNDGTTACFDDCLMPTDCRTGYVCDPNANVCVPTN